MTQCLFSIAYLKIQCSYSKKVGRSRRRLLGVMDIHYLDYDGFTGVCISPNFIKLYTLNMSIFYISIIFQ